MYTCYTCIYTIYTPNTPSKHPRNTLYTKALVFIVFLQFVVTYWVDKWAFTRLYRAPPKYSNAVAMATNNVQWVAIFCHICFATWMFSNPEIFDNADDTLR